MDYLIVTRHKGLVEWLAARNITGQVIEMATKDDVKGKDVVGVLPPYLACLAASLTTVDLPKMTMEQRGKDLTPAELDEAGAELTTYEVNRREIGDCRLNGPWVEAWLDGASGTKWYRVAGMQGAVTTTTGDLIGTVADYNIWDLWADAGTGAVCANGDTKKEFTNGASD